jgi:hypothetical protein
MESAQVHLAMNLRSQTWDKQWDRKVIKESYGKVIYRKAKRA